MTSSAAATIGVALLVGQLAEVAVDERGGLLQHRHRPDDGRRHAVVRPPRSGAATVRSARPSSGPSPPGSGPCCRSRPGACRLAPSLPLGIGGRRYPRDANPSPIEERDDLDVARVGKEIDRRDRGRACSRPRAAGRHPGPARPRRTPRGPPGRRAVAAIRSTTSAPSPARLGSAITTSAVDRIPAPDVAPHDLDVEAGHVVLGVPHRDRIALDRGDVPPLPGDGAGEEPDPGVQVDHPSGLVGHRGRDRRRPAPRRRRSGSGRTTSPRSAIGGRRRARRTSRCPRPRARRHRSRPRCPAGSGTAWSGTRSRVAHRCACRSAARPR